uniref:Uncharacterized protein n=1 Tax=Myotis myotis TaxID=51298 RepID=A0A7J7WVR4_MYOMY|nr:hypothetical protein mMyoMyo1_011854 [Myotis myotis]
MLLVTGVMLRPRLCPGGQPHGSTQASLLVSAAYAFTSLGSGHVMSLEKEKRPPGKDELGDNRGWICLSGPPASSSTCRIVRNGSRMWSSAAGLCGSQTPGCVMGAGCLRGITGRTLRDAATGRAGQVGQEEVGRAQLRRHSWAHSSTVDLARPRPRPKSYFVGLHRVIPAR